MAALKVAISYPPMPTDKGVPLLAQNRQFQYFNEPTYIYPCIPAYAATVLKQDGNDVVWDDGISEKKTYEGWLRDILREDPDVIAIESKTPTIKFHWRVIDLLKRELPETKIVLMGDHVTALPEESMTSSRVDFVLTGGDYDFMLRNLARSLEGKENLEPGFWFRADGEIRSNGPWIERGHDVTKLPYIDRDLTKWWLYAYENGNYKALPGTYTMVGRDCWWRYKGGCTFCSWTTIYKSYRIRTPDQLLGEIRFLVDNYGVKEVMDDTGTFPVGDWLRRFCEGMIASGLNREVRILCNMKPGALSLDQYKLMRKAGFRWVLFGVESGNQRTMDRLVKGQKIETVGDSIRDAKTAGLEPQLAIMFGYPWEDRADAMETVRFAGRLLRKGYADTLQVTIVIPYPGTPLFEEAKTNGWLKTLDWDEYDMRKPVMSAKLSEEEIHEFVQTMYKEALSPEFIIRKIGSVRNLSDVRAYMRYARKLVFGHLKDFAEDTPSEESQMVTLKADA
jgi:radical SAM superfamily enzyme YgiQ (UPF0313 family)